MTRSIRRFYLLMTSFFLLGCQSLQTLHAVRYSLHPNFPHSLASSSLATVGLPNCSGVLIHPQLVLTQSSCLSSVSQNFYVIFGQERNQPVRKLVEIKSTEQLTKDFALIHLKGPAPKPYMALAMGKIPSDWSSREVPLRISSYAGSGDLQSFGQLNQKESRLISVEGDYLFAEGSCLPAGSPLVLRHEAKWMLVGIALSPENCQALGGKAAFLRLDPLLSETIAHRTQKPIETLPNLAGVNFRLMREIRVDQMPYQANVAFEARPQAKSCEYALRVIRHNSYFETRYELRSQTVDPREKSQAQLIFQDIYANLSPLIGRVKHVELSTVVCHKA